MVRDGLGQELGSFGYDVLPPAVLLTGEIAIAGYYGSGACLINERGESLWARPDFREADSLVSVNRFNEIAFGNLNEGESLVVTKSGVDVFKIPFYGTFSEHPDGWVIAGRGLLGLVDRLGQQQWKKAVANEIKLGMEQASCDIDGRIYLPVKGGIAAFDRTGEMLFYGKVLKHQKQPRNIALIENKAVFTIDKRFVVVG